MKTWKIPVYWECSAVIDVTADTLAEAIEIARDDNCEIPVPSDGDYVDGSWAVDDISEDEIRSLWNDNQKDEK